MALRGRPPAAAAGSAANALTAAGAAERPPTAASTMSAKDRKIIDHIRMNARTQTTTAAMAVTTTAPAAPPLDPGAKEMTFQSLPAPAGAFSKPKSLMNRTYGSVPMEPRSAVDAESLSLDCGRQSTHVIPCTPWPTSPRRRRPEQRVDGPPRPLKLDESLWPVSRRGPRISARPGRHFTRAAATLRCPGKDLQMTNTPTVTAELTARYPAASEV